MKLTIAMILLVSCALAVAQDEQNAAYIRTKVLALENAWNLAEEHKDVKALDGLLASSLVYIDYDGTLMNKAQFLTSVRTPSLHPEQIVNESMTASVYGDTVVVTGVYHDKGAQSGKAYFRRGRFTDTWVRQNGEWACVASQSTLISH